ncbi:helix-turn-helix domain-containing protein [Brevibacillus sp. NRS-1366]|uniref:helix-turn-helix domain-containing protein n=1 Tax=Brevibacillus sp. NRS-1366 TaxID=3233899 RepID=UPI003D1D562C
MSVISMGFKERLKELRTKKGLTQEALAASLDIPESTIRRLESSDEGLPRRERLERIADFFGVQIDYLLGRTNEPSPSDNNDNKNNTDELTSILYHKWDKLDERRRKQALKLIDILEQEADEENNKD